MAELQFLGISLSQWIVIGIVVIAAFILHHYYIRILKQIGEGIKQVQKYRYFSRSISFFKGISDLIAIIGGVVTIISLSPLFLTLILGSDWYHILLITQFGITALDAIIIATYFAAFFIYCLLSLIAIQWINKILLSNDVKPNEKLFSFTILLSGAISVFCIVLFLLNIWVTRRTTPISLFVLTTILLILAFSLVIAISGLYGMIKEIKEPTIRKLFYIIPTSLILVTIITVMIPAITSNYSVFSITTDYAKDENSNFTFQSIKILNNTNTSSIVSIIPNYSDYSESVNNEYLDCHWSTNFGYFFTINSNTTFFQRHSDDFVNPKCIQKQEELVFWTYDYSDFGKTKPPIIISLQIENSNKKTASDYLGESFDYTIGNAHVNLSWIGRDNLTINHNNFLNQTQMIEIQ